MGAAAPAQEPRPSRRHGALLGTTPPVTKIVGSHYREPRFSYSGHSKEQYRERKKKMNILIGVRKVVVCINWRKKVIKKENVSSYFRQTKKENVSSYVRLREYHNVNYTSLNLIYK